MPKKKKGGKKRRSSRSSSKKTRRRRLGLGRRVRRIRRGLSFGRIGWKGAIVGGLLLAGIKYLIRRFAPQYSAYESNLALIGAGLVKKSFLPAGIAMTVGDLIVDYLTPGGLVTAPWVGAKTVKGYEIA